MDNLLEMEVEFHNGCRLTELEKTGGHYNNEIC